jgi:hypothetical protein
MNRDDRLFMDFDQGYEDDSPKNIKRRGTTSGSPGFKKSAVTKLGKTQSYREEPSP